MGRTLSGAGLWIACLLLPIKSFALVELDIAFDPAEICPGNAVRFLSSLENVGDEAEVVTLSVTFTVNGDEYGPFEGDLPLAAGEVISKEVVLLIPPWTPPTTVTVTVSATDSDGTVEDSAMLEVLDCGGASKSTKRLIGNIRNMVRDILGQRAESRL